MKERFKLAEAIKELEMLPPFNFLDDLDGTDFGIFGLERPEEVSAPVWVEVLSSLRDWWDTYHRSNPTQFVTEVDVQIVYFGEVLNMNIILNSNSCL